MDKEQAINLAKRYKEMVAEKLPLKALYLYGSYSKGNYRGSSLSIKSNCSSDNCLSNPVLSASLDSECIFRGTSIKQLVQYALRIFSII